MKVLIPFFVFVAMVCVTTMILHFGLKVGESREPAYPMQASAYSFVDITQ